MKFRVDSTITVVYSTEVEAETAESARDKHYTKRDRLSNSEFLENCEWVDEEIEVTKIELP